MTAVPTTTGDKPLLDSRITVIIVTMDYHMKRAKRHAKVRCHYDNKTSVVEIKERMLDRINRGPHHLPSNYIYTYTDLFVTLVLTEIGTDSVDSSTLGTKEKVSLVFMDDFRTVMHYVSGRKVDKKKSYFRLIIREAPASK